MEYSEQKGKSILLTENNVLDIYKKLIDKKEVSEEEKAKVIKRFYEILNYEYK